MYNKADCIMIDGARTANEVSHFNTGQCYNKYRLVSEQRPTYTNTANPSPNRINSFDYQWANVINLANPTQSSDEGKYDATRAMSRQWGLPVHTYLNDNMWPSSCSVTQREGTQWWQADFEGGERPVRMVRLTYAIPHEFKERMNGAKVFVDDHLCGYVDNEKAGGKGFFVEVGCDDFVGKSIRIEQEDQGVAFCEISAYKGDRFPTELPFIWG
jgi:hypothetical protein